MQNSLHLGEKIEAKLKKLQDNNIIEDATGPSLWVSLIVTILEPKNPEYIRSDLTSPINLGIKHEPHNTPTVDQLIAQLTYSKVFLKLDLKSSYPQMKINPDSRYITTFLKSMITVYINLQFTTPIQHCC